MDSKRIESFKEFAKYLEYPMVVFEAATGKVIDLNYEAELMLGSKVEQLQFEPGRAVTKVKFWEKLHDKKTLMWNRIRIKTSNGEHLVSGLVNEASVGGQVVYTLLFEPQADLNLGNIILERILKQAELVALHIHKQEEEFKIQYSSKNINRYGYTREQIYTKAISPKEMVCTEDWERVYHAIMNAANNHAEEFSVDCRVYTEARELIPIRIHIHYVYNDFGNLTDLEVLIMDLREEMSRSSESMYLSQALKKFNRVVMVKSYCKGEQQVKYISSNADILGINAEALKKGYKLTEDYIHPADRERVNNTLFQAIANDATDYTHSYRMVRDDGKQIWVQNEVTINRITDGEAEVTFLLSDITEQKKIEAELVNTSKTDASQPVEIKEEDDLSLITIDEQDKEMLAQLQLMAETLNQNADYYSVVLDAEGKLLTQPVGPVSELGQFYDLFERPEFKEQFVLMTQRAKEQMIPQRVTFSAGDLEVHIIFAPLMLKDVVTAYLTLTSFVEGGLQILDVVADQQWKLANIIAKSSYIEDVVANEEKFRKVAELLQQREQQAGELVRDLMRTVVSQGEAGLGGICHKVTDFLNISSIGLYLENKENKVVENYFKWSHAGTELLQSDYMELSVSEYGVIKEYFKTEKVLLPDQNTQEMLFKKMVLNGGAEAVMLLPIMLKSHIRGYVVFADEKVAHKFDDKDIRFAESVTHVFECMLLNRQRIGKSEMLKENVFEVYDYIEEAVLVKDNKTGDIVFANKAMEQMFGYSLVGMQAKDVVSDQPEQYKSIGGLRKHFITHKKVTKWQSYMKELDQIMNVVEIHMETSNRADYSLIILKNKC